MYTYISTQEAAASCSWPSYRPAENIATLVIILSQMNSVYIPLTPNSFIYFIIILTSKHRISKCHLSFRFYVHQISLSYHLDHMHCPTNPVT